MHQVTSTIHLLEDSVFYYVITTGMNGTYTYVNKHYARTFGYRYSDLVGQPYYITMHDDDRRVCEETSMRCFNEPNRSFPATIRKHDGNGGYVVTQWEFRAMMDDNGEPIGVFCLGHNITEMVKSNTELEKTKIELADKTTMLEQIGWEQSHVLRRPLANIQGLTGILSNMELDQNMSNICDMLTDSTEQLDKVIKDIVKRAEN
jgi:PAS domain S-box-containing protein